ncbi:hypothetical protein EDB89DRAFT_1909383 [Lactarius sanguifluus]|nr:hypothetical protein EDB89DRAFT_1909383 [Lactarius sanguifluus]
MTPTSPPVAVAVQHITGRRASLDVPDAPVLPSPSLVLFPTESHSSMLAPTAPSPSHPQLSSAPDINASAEGEGSAKVALHKEKAAHDSPSMIQENTMTAPGLPLQSPPPLSITDITTTGPSSRSLDVEHTGDHSPHPSYGQYDIIRTYRKIWGNLEHARACEDTLQPRRGWDEWELEDGCKSVRSITTDETREEDAVSSTNKGVCNFMPLAPTGT